jgi:hypothetical protein
MQYMLLIYNDPALQPAYGTPEFQAMMGGYFAANEKMKSDGVLRAGESLHGIENATSLSMKSGKVETMDGPFAETKEYLGGYYIVDVPDLDAALKYAALIPSAAFGTIEVRPLMNYNPAG